VILFRRIRKKKQVMHAPKYSAEPQHEISDENSDTKSSVTWLNVPFEDNQQVKALGGRWDRQARSWFVPAGIDPTPFGPWLLSTRAQSVSSEGLGLDSPGPEMTITLLGLERSCWKCRRETVSLVGLVPLGGNSSNEVVWFNSSDLARKVTAALLDEPTRQRTRVGIIKNRYSQTTKSEYLSNGCYWCGALQGGPFSVFRRGARGAELRLRGTRRA
jgi:hypothetical protein